MSSLPDSKILSKSERPENAKRQTHVGNLEEIIQNAFDDRLMKTYGDRGITEKEIDEAGFHYCCKKGLRPEMPNQDNVIIAEFDQWKVFGVTDGFGPHGHNVSAQIANHLPRILLEKIYSSREPILEHVKIFKESFAKVHEDLVHQANHSNEFDVAISGCTVTLCLVDTSKRKLYYGQLGDCKLTLCMNEKGKHKTKELLIEHKPTLPAEKKRILATGGEIKRLEGDFQFRIFQKGRVFPGLTMTRCLGCTVGHSIGLNCEPDVLEQDLMPIYEFIIVATDGVWEVCNPKYVSSLLQLNEKDPKNGCLEICQQSYKRWLQQDSTIVDDVTCLIFDVRYNKDNK